MWVLYPKKPSAAALIPDPTSCPNIGPSFRTSTRWRQGIQGQTHRSPPDNRRRGKLRSACLNIKRGKGKRLMNKIESSDQHPMLMMINSFQRSPTKVRQLLSDPSTALTTTLLSTQARLLSSVSFPSSFGNQAATSARPIDVRQRKDPLEAFISP